jgi:hypothetical protein
MTTRGRAAGPGRRKMSSFSKLLLSFLVLAVLAVFAVEIFFLVKHGYILAVRDIFGLFLGR